MNPVLHTLPLDWSGESLDNRIPSEWHDLSDQYDLPFRVIVLRHGYFFAESLRIMDGNGYELKKDLDYQTVAFNGEAAEKIAEPVCGVIAITNPHVHYIVRVTAQMLGGPYCSVVPSIAEAAKGLLNTTRKIHWNNITGKPDDFRPNGHLHALWELYGFTPQVLQLKRMTAGFEAIVQKDFDGLQQQFDQEMLGMELLLDEVEAQLTAHIADTVSNPHRDHKSKLIPSLGNVQNQPLAIDSEARLADSSVMNRYATPYSMGVSIKANFWDKFNEHVANVVNPHNVTAAQLNAYTIGEWNNLAQLYVPLHATTRYSNRIYGFTPNEYFVRTRSNNHTNQIYTAFGRVPPVRFSNLSYWPGRDYYLAPDQNWYQISPKFKAFEVLPTKLIPMYGSVVGSYAAAIAVCNASLADWTLYPPGTIALFNMPISRWIGTGNGGDIKTTTQNVAIIVRNAAYQWVTTTGPV
uniref:Virion structural protein n=1 Tax=Pseudomonas phage RVTF4 TaxID=3236931 RepID=A0AB39CDB0_9VIRU